MNPPPEAAKILGVPVFSKKYLKKRIGTNFLRTTEFRDSPGTRTKSLVSYGLTKYQFIDAFWRCIKFGSKLLNSQGCRIRKSIIVLLNFYLWSLWVNDHQPKKSLSLNFAKMTEILSPPTELFLMRCSLVYLKKWWYYFDKVSVVRGPEKSAKWSISFPLLSFIFEFDRAA